MASHQETEGTGTGTGTGTAGGFKPNGAPPPTARDRARIARHNRARKATALKSASGRIKKHPGDQKMCLLCVPHRRFRTHQGWIAHNYIMHTISKAERAALIKRRADGNRKANREKKAQAKEAAREFRVTRKATVNTTLTRNEILSAAQPHLHQIATLQDAIAYLETKRDWISSMILEFQQFANLHHT